MKKTKRLLMTVLAVIMLLSMVIVGVEAASLDTTSHNYGYMVPTDAKISKTVSTVKVYGNYDYINFYIQSDYDDMYFFYEIYSDKKMTKLVAGDYTYCAKSGSYDYTPWLTLKGKFNTGTYYGVTYAATIDGDGNATISEPSVVTFKLVVNKKPKYNQQMVILKSVTNTANGPTIKWYKLSSTTQKYNIYRRSLTGTKWTKVATVKGSVLSYTDKSIKDKNGKFVYTVRGIDKNGTLTRYHYSGLTCLFAKTPSVSSVATTYDNQVQVKWKSTAKSAVYNVYRKTDGGKWILIAKNFKGTTYLDKKTESGKNYRYTVRAVIPTEYGNAVSYYNNGKAVDFVGAPKLNPVTVVENGLNITWEKVTGATAYTVYRKTFDKDASWQNLGKFNNDVFSFTDTTANEDSSFIYTVRAEGKTSRGSYVNAGVEYFVLDKPVITSVKKWIGDEKQDIDWTGDSRTLKYNVYIKENGDWKLLGTTSNEYYTSTVIYGKSEYCVESVRNGLTSRSDSYKFECYPTVNVTAKENLVAGNRLQWQVHELAEKYSVYRAIVDGTTGEKTQFELLETLEVSGDEEYLEFLDENVVDGVNYIYKINAFYYGDEHEGDTEYKIYRANIDTNFDDIKIELESYNSYEYPDARNVVWLTLPEGYGYRFYNYNTGSWVTVTSHYSRDGALQLSEQEINEQGAYANQYGEYKIAFVYSVANESGDSYQVTSYDKEVRTFKFPEEYVEEIAAELESKQIKLSWKNVEGATKYIVTYTDTSYNENSIEIERSATDTTACYLPTDLEKNCTYDVELTTIYADGSKSIFSGKKVIMHAIPELTRVNKVVSKADGSNLVYVHIKDDIFYMDTAVLYRKAPGDSKWKAVRYLDDFDSYSGYGYAYRDKTADGTVAYTYTARYKADESKVGAETDIGSWYDEKGITLKV